MAYIKVFPIRASVKKFVKYVTNPDKTNEQILVSSFGCSPETAEATFEITRQRGIGNTRDTNGNRAWHIIQSFKPGEVSAEKAHEIGVQLAEQFLKGKYEFIVSTHIDKDHIHNHIALNATSFVDYKKFRMNKKIYHQLCRASNSLCAENGLTTSMPTKEKGKSYKEHQEYNRGNSWKAKLKVAVDKAIWKSLTFEEFLMQMQSSGYEVRQGKNLAFRAPDQKHFTNMRTLGSYYSIENVMKRLEKNRHRLRVPKTVTREIRLFIDIAAFVEKDNFAGFETWGKHRNLQEAARTFNYLSEHKLLNYEDFTRHVEDLEAAISASEREIKRIENEITNEHLLKKHCDTYRICKKVVEQGNQLSGGERTLYQKKHSQEYQLHDFEKEELRRLGFTKLPSEKKILAEIDSLQNRQLQESSNRQSLLRQQKELSVINTNFERMLNSASIHVERNKSVLENQRPENRD